MICNYCLHDDDPLPTDHERYVKCRVCGSLFLDPPATIEETTKANEQMFSGQTHPDNSGHMRLHPKWRERLETQWMQTMDDLSVPVRDPLTNYDWALDVGCASGKVLDWLRGLGWKTHGIEITSALSRYSNPNHDIRVGDLRDGKWDGLGFNLVTMFDVIEHIDDQLGMLKAIYKCMNPGGTFVIACPCAGPVYQGYKKEWRQLLVPQHIAIPSESGLSQALKGAGFVVMNSISWGCGMGDTGEVPDRHRNAWNKIVKAKHMGDTIAVRCTKPGVLSKNHCRGVL